MGTGLGTGAVLGCQLSLLRYQNPLSFRRCAKAQRRNLLFAGARDKQIPRRFAPRNDKCFGGLGKSKGKTKRARHILRARASRRVKTLAVLNRARAGVFDVNRWSGDFNPRHAGDVHAHSWASDLGQLNHNGVEIGFHQADACQSGLHVSFEPGAIGFQPGQLGLLAVRHCLKTVEFRLRLVDRTLNLRHGCGQRALGRVTLNIQHPGFGHELVGASGGQGQHGAGVMSDAVYDLVGPLHATLVVARIQSGCQNRCGQPSPCLCFHSLNPLCLIDEGPLNPLARDTEAVGRKFREGARKAFPLPSLA
jgi:hypothetical protein